MVMWITVAFISTAAFFVALTLAYSPAPAVAAAPAWARGAPRTGRTGRFADQRRPVLRDHCNANRIGHTQPSSCYNPKQHSEPRSYIGHNVGGGLRLEHEPPCLPIQVLDMIGEDDP